MKVYLGATHAATIQPSEHYCRLEYTHDYHKSATAVPLSHSLPLATAPHENRKVERWLENLIPENPAILAALQKQYRIPDLSNPVSILERIGRDVPGAFTFMPDGEAYDAHGAARKVTEGEIGDALGRLAALNMPYTPRLSLAGAQPKTSYAQGDDGSWYEATGAVPSTHIFKPPTPGNENIQYVEHVMQTTAARLGILTAETEVREFAGQPCLLIKRYDRAKTQDGFSVRLHQEDLLQALGWSRTRKYQHDSGPGLRELIQTVRLLCPQDEGRVWRLVAYNVAVGNSDAHGKNYSFLITPDGFRLAPAYDLNSLIPYPQYSQTLAMSIGGNYDYRTVTRRDWQEAARVAGSEESLVLEHVEYVNTHLASVLTDTITSLNVDTVELSQVYDYVRHHSLI